MDVTLAILADAANSSREGKLNILGAFSNLFAESFPIRHPEMQLVMRMEASPAEAGSHKKLKILMFHADGDVQEGFRVEGEFVVPEPKRAGKRVQMESILRLTDTRFDREGSTPSLY